MLFHRLNVSHRFVIVPIAILTVSVGAANAGDDCITMPFGDFELDLTGWTPETQTTEIGTAVSDATAQVIDGSFIQPFLDENVAELSFIAAAQGADFGPPGLAEAIVELSIDATITGEALGFTLAGFWEGIWFNTPILSHNTSVRIEELKGGGFLEVDLFGEEFVESPTCEIGLSIFGFYGDPESPEVVINLLEEGGRSTGLDIGDYVRITFRGEAYAEPVAVCDDGFFIGQMLIDNIAFCGAVNPADIDGDGCVNFNDLLILLAAWGECTKKNPGCSGDLDASGGVGFEDLLILLNAWQPCV